MVLQASYNIYLVLLSVVVAIFATYTALNFISRLNDPLSQHLIRIRIGAGGLVMGLGIWSMHFIGMVAYSLPVPVRYDGPVTLWSLVVAIVACVVGLAIASRRQAFIWAVIGGLFLGAGISSMHYVGMAAMRMPATMHYDSLLVSLSVLIGIGAAIAAIWVAFAIGRGEISGSFKIKATSSVIMGIAIAGMHYTGMAAMTVYGSTSEVASSSGFELNPGLIGASLTVSVILLMSFALWSSRLVTETNIIRTNEEKVSAITENVLDVIITINTNGTIEFANPSVKSVFGYQPDELIGKNVSVLMPSPFKEKHDQYIQGYLRTGQSKVIGLVQREFKGVHRDGTIFPVEISVSETSVAGKQMFIGTMRDISERIEAQQRLYYLAHHDVLTALPNRLSFQEYIKQSLVHARRGERFVAVLFMDLDRFKNINDTLGHHVGDFLLTEVAQRLAECGREGDIISRLSGDEFTILLDDVASQDDVTPIAQKIISCLSKPFAYSGHELFTTASIGISMFPKDGEDPSALMRHADIAMYRAKAQGGNQYCFYSPDMNVNADKRLSLETDLRYALERGEFTLHYQPQVDIENGVYNGVEALLRWQHPKLGLLAPHDFISLLEETGLIIPVGEWVIRTACQQNLAWRKAGIPPLKVAVNLSARQFNEKDLANNVAGILHEAEMSAEYLELEITENILMNQSVHTIYTLLELHALGIQLAIDDFGTGYSSLSYLQKFPIHTLKIDRSFVRDISSNADDAAIVKLIIDMAHSLKLNVLAEGVETDEQLDYLRRRNCWEMQGYYFDQPKPADEVSLILSKGLNIKQYTTLAG